MLTNAEMEDVLDVIGAELGSMFDRVTNHYSRPRSITVLAELDKIEAYLKVRLLEYDPNHALTNK